MPTITLDDTLWSQIARIARQSHHDPEALAADALRDFVQRQSDEQLLAESSAAAEASPFDIDETEAVIRAYRAQRLKAA